MRVNFFIKGIEDRFSFSGIEKVFIEEEKIDILDMSIFKLKINLSYLREPITILVSNFCGPLRLVKEKVDNRDLWGGPSGLNIWASSDCWFDSKLVGHKKEVYSSYLKRKNPNFGPHNVTNGMVVEFKNGYRALVCKDTLVSNRFSLPFNRASGFKDECNSNFDIVKVYRHIDGIIPPFSHMFRLDTLELVHTVKIDEPKVICVDNLTVNEIKNLKKEGYELKLIKKEKLMERGNPK